MTGLAVEARDLGKRFTIYRRPIDRLLRRDGAQAKEHWALRHVDLAVPQGRCLGVIGVNGAGKSTLLKLLTGVIRPTEGSLALSAPPLALLELGTGFNGELTGRENLFATGMLLGYTVAEIAERLPAIRDFADIGDYFDQPMKTYSSGMFVRLAFALYINLDCEVLIVDEALSVGDFFFQQKCAAALRSIKKRGTTILFVSHDTAALQELADEAILLDHGRIVACGDSNTVISRYHAATHGPMTCAQQGDHPEAALTTVPHTSTDEAIRRRIEDIRREDVITGAPSTGMGGARMLALRVVNAKGQPAQAFPSGARAYIEAVIECIHDISFPNLGVFLVDAQDRLIWSAANSNQAVNIGRMDSGRVAVVSLELTLAVEPGVYRVNCQVGEFDPEDSAYGVAHDLRVNCVELEVTTPPHRSDRVGVGDLPMEIRAL